MIASRSRMLMQRKQGQRDKDRGVTVDERDILTVYRYLLWPHHNTQWLCTIEPMVFCKTCFMATVAENNRYHLNKIPPNPDMSVHTQATHRRTIDVSRVGPACQIKLGFVKYQEHNTCLCATNKATRMFCNYKFCNNSFSLIKILFSTLLFNFVLSQANFGTYPTYNSGRQGYKSASGVETQILCEYKKQEKGASELNSAKNFMQATNFSICNQNACNRMIKFHIQLLEHQSIIYSDAQPPAQQLESLHQENKSYVD